MRSAISSGLKFFGRVSCFFRERTWANGFTARPVLAMAKSKKPFMELSFRLMLERLYRVWSLSM